MKGHGFESILFSVNFLLTGANPRRASVSLFAENGPEPEIWQKHRRVRPGQFFCGKFPSILLLVGGVSMTVRPNKENGFCMQMEETCATSFLIARHVVIVTLRNCS